MQKKSTYIQKYEKEYPECNLITRRGMNIIHSESVKELNYFVEVHMWFLHF